MGNKLKVLAISDLHGYLPEIKEKADILLISGDISPLNIQWKSLEMIDWLMGDFLVWVKSLPVYKIFLIAGNHDFIFEDSSHLIKNIFDQYMPNLVYLEDELYTYNLNGVDWTIYGTPWSPTFGRWPFMKSEDNLIRIYNEIPNKVDIIMTHCPPYGINKTGVILENTYKEDVGSHSLANRLKEIDYKLCVCGHIHSGNHKFDEETKVVNVSLLNENYKPVYDIFKIELNKSYE